jgi:hypothetical protein
MMGAINQPPDLTISTIRTDSGEKWNIQFIRARFDDRHAAVSRQKQSPDPRKRESSPRHLLRY